MTEYNEPNRFCGECAIYLNYGEPGITPKQNVELLNYCKKECKAWRHDDGIQLLNKDNVGQCWHCLNQIDKELVNTTSGEQIYLPYCIPKMSYVCGLKGECHCHSFELR